METPILFLCLFTMLSFIHLGFCAWQSHNRRQSLPVDLSNKLRYWGTKIQTHTVQGHDVVVRMPTHMLSDIDLPLEFWKHLHCSLKHHLHPLCATKELEVTKTVRGRTFQILNLRKVVSVSKYPDRTDVLFDISIKVKEISDPNCNGFWLRTNDHVYQAGWQIRPL